MGKWKLNPSPISNIISNFLFSYFIYDNVIVANEATERNKKRGCLGGRIITPRNVGKNSQILRNPLKFAFLTIFGCK